VKEERESCEEVGMEYERKGEKDTI